MAKQRLLTGVAVKALEDFEPGPPPVIEVPMYGGGLNAGAELDHELPIEQILVPEVQEEAPKIEGDFDMVAIESRLNDLFYLARDIVGAGGMNQTFALEAEKLIPGFGGGVPIGYYSKDLTATRHRVALEEISNGIWALIGAAVLAISVVLYKFISWLFGGKTDGDPKANAAKALEKAEQQAEVAREAPHELNELAQTTQHAVADMDHELSKNPLVIEDDKGQKFSYDRLDKIIEDWPFPDARFENARKFMEKPTPFAHDVSTNGAYTKLILETGVGLRTICNDLSMKVDYLAELSQEDIHDKTAASRDTRGAELNTLMNNEFKLRISGKEMTPEELFKHIGEAEFEMNKNPHPGKLSFDTLPGTLVKAYQHAGFSELLMHIATTANSLDEYAKKCEAIGIRATKTSDGVHGGQSMEYGKTIRDVNTKLKSEISQLLHITTSVKDFVSKVEAMRRETMLVIGKVCQAITTHVTKGGREAPASWQKLSDQLKEKESFFNRVR